jgi:hypothetical protein
MEVVLWGGGQKQQQQKPDIVPLFGGYQKQE